MSGNKRKLDSRDESKRKTRSNGPASNKTNSSLYPAKGNGLFTPADISVWLRSPFDNNPTDPLIFLQLDVASGYDHINKKPVIRIYGTTAQGNSVCCRVHGFESYFYVGVPLSTSDDYPQILLNGINETFSRRQIVTSAQYVVGVNDLYTYSENSRMRFIKLVVSDPDKINECVKLVNKSDWPTFESDVDYVTRFMVDARMTGSCWIELATNNFKFVKDNKQTLCQVEVDVEYNTETSVIKVHEPYGEWSTCSNFRILSFDIECAGRRGIFPTPLEDPVIQIANIVTRYGEKEPFIRNVFTLNTCKPIHGSRVFSFKNENELLNAWSQFVCCLDPDLLTGYNITNFDIPYLIQRAHHLKCTDFAFLGRVKSIKSVVKEKELASKQMGRRSIKNVNIEGRVVFDVMLYMLRDHKLRSYSLNSVSYHFLNEQKEDVHHSMITDLQNGDDDTRHRLAVYCLKDAILPLRLLDKLMCLVNYIEMSRVTGTTLDILLKKGQQAKVMSQLLRNCIERGFLIPDTRRTRDRANDLSGYEGATVIEPKRGYYNSPIATLDFSSLYPSIMMAHNLCYSTLLPPGATDLNKDMYTITPSGDRFVKPCVRKGVLPFILENLIAARKVAKKELKDEKDEFRAGILDGRQSALKMSANSVYGFTGAQNGKLPCLQISASVTAYGREMIERTKREVERIYNVTNGYAHDAVVIYGDTDSVMVKFGEESLERTLE